MADIKQSTEENDLLKQFMKLLNQQSMGEQSQDFMELFKYAAGMQLQLASMAEELQGVRHQLSQLQENQPKSVKENLMDKVAHIQDKVISLSERILAVAAQAVNAFKEKGKSEMCRAVRKGISGMKSALMDYRERLVDVMIDCQKTACQIDSIGDELKQIENSVSNVGRLLTGKETKEVSDEKQGVGLTRIINKPVKKAVKNLRKDIAFVDKTFVKLDRMSERFSAGKEAERGGRLPIKDKLSQMKAKADQQKKALGPDKAETKSRAECL